MTQPSQPNPGVQHADNDPAASPASGAPAPARAPPVQGDYQQPASAPPGGGQPPAQQPPPQQGRPSQQAPAQPQREQATDVAARAAERAANAATQTAQQVSILVQQMSVLVQQLQAAERYHRSATHAGGTAPPSPNQAGNQPSNPIQTAAQPTGAQSSPGHQTGQAISDTAQQQAAPSSQAGGAAEGVGSPNVDIYDAAEELTVFCDLPGVRPEDIRLEGDKRRLRIVAERQLSDIEEERSPVQHERPRRVERTIDLPADVRVEQAEASCENGVCQVWLPKMAKHPIGVH